MSIIFHGLLNRAEYAHLLHLSKIGINPYDVSQTPGNVFAFKIIEFLGAGAHVITTPMGVLEPELEAGITYMADNEPDTIAATLKRVILNCNREKSAMDYVCATYAPTVVSEALDILVRQVARIGRSNEKRVR
jgi:hypothetical protein